MQDNPVARQMAGLILFILMIGAGIAASVSLYGNTTLALQICGGALVLTVLVLVFGGLVVASNEDESS